MLKKIIKKLYLKYCSADLVAVTRIQMGATPFEVYDLDELPNNERKDISKEADYLLNNAVFKMAVSNVKARLMAHIRDEAPDATAIFCDRFSINGVYLLEQELDSYLYLQEETDNFNPYSLT